MIYKGIAHGRLVELEDPVVLPEGTEVDILVRQRAKYFRGSPQALLGALDVPPRCRPADVDLLVQAIEQGKGPTRVEGAFDHEGRRP